MILYFFDTRCKNSDATDKLILKSTLMYAKEKGIHVSDNLPTVVRSQRGKPYIEGLPLHVSVAHTDNMVIVGVSQINFGIDCERRTRKITNMKAVVRRRFTEEEQRYVSVSEEGAAERFIEVWVRKEAYVKYLGSGLADLSCAETEKFAENFFITERNGIIICVYTPYKPESIVTVVIK